MAKRCVAPAGFVILAMLVIAGCAGVGLDRAQDRHKAIDLYQ